MKKERGLQVDDFSRSLMLGGVFSLGISRAREQRLNADSALNLARTLGNIQHTEIGRIRLLERYYDRIFTDILIQYLRLHEQQKMRGVTRATSGPIN